MLGRIWDVVIGGGFLALAALQLAITGNAGYLAPMAIGAYALWRGLRRPPELTWWQRRRRRRNRAWLTEHRSMVQDHGLREAVRQNAAARTRGSTRAIYGFLAIIIVGVLVIAATQGFQPSGG